MPRGSSSIGFGTAVRLTVTNPPTPTHLTPYKLLALAAAVEVLGLMGATAIPVADQRQGL